MKSSRENQSDGRKTSNNPTRELEQTYKLSWEGLGGFSRPQGLSFGAAVPRIVHIAFGLALERESSQESSCTIRNTLWNVFKNVTKLWHTLQQGMNDALTMDVACQYLDESRCEGA